MNQDSILSLYNPTNTDGESIRQGFFFNNSSGTVTEFARIESTANETQAGSTKAGDLRFYTTDGDDTPNMGEKFRIASAGQIGLGGANYGSSGQVLTSGGADASVSWGDGSNVPVGGIILWSGLIASIPTNWALCNGSNGTPDLRNTFIVGAHSDAVVGVNTATTTITGSNTKTGGSKDAVVVSHNHSYVTKGGNYTGDSHTEQSETWKLESTVNTGDSGESGTNKNLPPYYALAYIMRIS